MTNVAIQPCADPAARAHYEHTIARPVSLESIATHVTLDDYEALRGIYGNEGVPTWGATAGKNDVNVSQWSKLSEGDVVLFMREHHVFASGIISYKLRSDALARALWSLKDGQPFEYVFFLRDMHAQQVHYDVIRQAADLSPNWNPLRFWVIDDERSARILAALPTNDSRDGTSPKRTGTAGLPTVRTTADVRASIAAFNAEATLDARSILAQTSYWVYDPDLNAFGPSKFVGLKGQTLVTYAAAKAVAAAEGRLSGFDGHTSRNAIERAVGQSFEPSAALSATLLGWVIDLVGVNVLEAVDQSKWQFLALPANTTFARPSRRPHPTPNAEKALAEALNAARDPANFPSQGNEEDARKRIFADIVRRRGQAKFRRMLLAAYGGRCAVTGCDVEAAIEAAHLISYNGDATNHPTNGIPMRGDIHTLFDLRLLTIEPATYTITLDTSIRSTHYGVYHGRQLSLPHDVSLHPNAFALQQRLQTT